MAKQQSKGERVILLASGDSGTGKSFFVGCLKRALIFDTDIGGGLAYLDARIQRNGSERIEVGSYLDVENALKERRSILKDFNVLAIDHLSTLQAEAVQRHNPRMVEGTFGKEYDKANKEWRRVREFARYGDFHLVCTSHLKAKYENNKAVGMQADAAKNIAADFTMHLFLESQHGKYPSTARVVKWRRDPEDVRGQVPGTFPFTLENFIAIHGYEMDGLRQEIPMATEEQIAEVKRLLEIVKLEDGVVERWFTKAKAEDWTDFTREAMDKCVKYLNEKMSGKGAAA